MSLNDDSGGFQIQVKNQYLMVCTKAGLVKGELISEDIFNLVLSLDLVLYTHQLELIQ